jgi:hypothetical protein
MPWINRGIAIALLLGCLALWPATASFPGSAAAFPRLILILIAVLCGLMMLRSFFPRLASAATGEGKRSLAALGLPTLTLAVVTVAVTLVQFAGFFLTFAGFGVVLMFVLSVERRATYLASYAGLLVFVYLVFVLLLDVPIMNPRLWAG